MTIDSHHRQPTYKFTSRAPTQAIIMSSGQLLGQCIDVHAQTFIARPNSDGGVGVVTHEHDDGSFDIRFSVSNTCEKRIVRERVKSYNPLVLTARRLNGTDVERPSLLAPLHRPSAGSGTQRPTAPRVSPPESPRGVSNILPESRSWSEYDAQYNPLLFYLREGKDKSRGWLRLVRMNTTNIQRGVRRGRHPRCSTAGVASLPDLETPAASEIIYCSSSSNIL